MRMEVKAIVRVWVFLFALLSVTNHATAQPAPQGPAHLGVTIDNDDQGVGALVSGVLRRSPAEVAGVATGDRILMVGDRSVNSVFEVRAALRRFNPGDRVPITLQSPTRKKPVIVTVRVEARPSPEVVLDRQLSGLPLPDFRLQFLSGPNKNTISSNELRGKLTIVEFWATWCGPCRKISPKLAKLQSQSPGKIQVVGVSHESVGTIRKFLARNPSHYPIAHDIKGLGHTRCAVVTIPTMLLVNAQGMVVGTYIGLGGLANLQADVASRLATLR